MGWTTPQTWATNDLVTAALMNTHVRDNLNYLLTPNQFAVSESSGTYSTTSTTYVAVNANYSKSITLNGGHLLVGIDGYFSVTGGGSYIASVVLDIDGTTQIPVSGTYTGAANPIPNMSWTYLVTGLSAASHTFTLKWKVSNALGTSTIDKTYIPLIFWGVEL